MPNSCWVKNCFFQAGRILNGHEIKLHCFPNLRERILDWLRILIPSGEVEVFSIAEEILSYKKKRYNKYHICSLHFSDESFIVNAGGRLFRPVANPSIFENFLDYERKVLEPKKYKKKRLQNTTGSQQSVTPSSSESSVPTESRGHTVSLSCLEVQQVSENVEILISKFTDASTQTEFNLTNSIIISMDKNLTLREEESPLRQPTNIVHESTPLPDCSQSQNRHQINPFIRLLSPIVFENEKISQPPEEDGNDDDLVSGIFPLTGDLEDSYNISSLADAGEIRDSRDHSYDPLMKCNLKTW
ncbi:uncharacterized protein LOC122939025 [Bufo gargarizans]|uniref:uncharacterized protein LOC122939025 n=1 Tax=Bufo gargarizans TaxID=30331 RepID=UPI001CF3DA05|nr:uncharacterized protein LOC122939025 [Bufo gargarizans]